MLDIDRVRCDIRSEMVERAVMLTLHELVWLHTLQTDLALKRDWVAVGHVQSLIDHMANEHGLACEGRFPISLPLETH